MGMHGIVKIESGCASKSIYDSVGKITFSTRGFLRQRVSKKFKYVLKRFGCKLIVCYLSMPTSFNNGNILILKHFYL